MPNDAQLLKSIWWAGVRAVRGQAAVATALETENIPQPDRIIAVGKAAASMAEAAVMRFPEISCVVFTKYGHAQEVDLPGNVEIHESSHPVPDEASMASGNRLLDCVANMPVDSHLLLLVSGGASSLVEVPEAGLSLKTLAAENARLLAAGLDIHAMNRRRRELSRIKGGRLLEAFRGSRVTCLAISDVEGDDIGVIGSGIGAAPRAPAFNYTGRIVASNAIARAAAAVAAKERGLMVLSSKETLYADVGEAAERITADLDGTPGVRIWGGEPTTLLPEEPGEGGRNQALALLTAKRIAGRKGVTVLIGGTDGSDGPTTAAGGIVDGSTWTSEAADHLARADSGPFLRRRGALFETGPTGTNVMDIAVALQR